MPDKPEPTEVTVVDTDFESEENPLNSNGYIGVDPYFQGAPLDTKPEPEEKKEEEKTPVVTSPNVPPVTK